MRFNITKLICGALPLFALMLAACGGGNNNPAIAALSPCSGGINGSTVALTAPFINASGLAYDATASTQNSTPPSYYEQHWASGTACTLVMAYKIDATNGDTVALIISTPPNGLAAGLSTTASNDKCVVPGTGTNIAGGTNSALAACSAWGITITRGSAGVSGSGALSFSATPVIDLVSGATGTAASSGSFSFTGF